MNGLILRPYRRTDADALGDIFHRAIQDGARRRYTSRQRDAWSPARPEGPLWDARLARVDTIVAEHEGRVLGFMALDLSVAYLDLAFVAPEAMGRGVAAAIYAVVEGRALAAGLAALETQASRLSEPFFRRRGWTLIARQKVERRGVRIPNAQMVKTLNAAPMARAA